MFLIIKNIFVVCNPIVMKPIPQLYRRTYIYLLKSNAIPVTGSEGREGCAMLRISHCLDNQLTDGGQFASLSAGRALPKKDLVILPVRG
jgi:hypothetical protein